MAPTNEDLSPAVSAEIHSQTVDTPATSISSNKGVCGAEETQKVTELGISEDT